MEEEKIRGKDNINRNEEHEHEHDDDDVHLPGFRFHPTDEELVGFYLRRKVEKRPISIELIKQIDIYKYDPWDLPKGSNVGDKEWYFFCRRGRKYRNSVRPNRVTGSGFWKATGIDKPIHSAGGHDSCIGLKKSLVYYRGSAGKGTKTDWMMHEFRLPPHQYHHQHSDPKSNIPQEAEVWTICRIFKRNAPTYRKCIADWRELSAKRNTDDSSSKTCDSLNVYSDINRQGHLMSFREADPPEIPVQKATSSTSSVYNHVNNINNIHEMNGQLLATSVTQAPSTAYSTSFVSLDMIDSLKYKDWDELRPVVEFSGNHPFLL